MPRPSRIDLMKRFFPELGRAGTSGDTEAAIGLNTRACEAILADQIQLFDQFRAERGPGALCLKLADGDRASFYVTLDDFCADLLTAEQVGDLDTSAMLKDVIRAVKTTNLDQQVLILLIDNSRASLLPLPREYPARAIQAMQEEFTV